MSGGEVEPLALERVRAADADRADDVRPVARADLVARASFGALVRHDLERHVDVGMGRVEVGDDLVLDRLLLGRVAAAEAAVPAELDLAGRGAVAGVVTAARRAPPDAAPAATRRRASLADDPPQAPDERGDASAIEQSGTVATRMQLLLGLGRWLGSEPSLSRDRSSGSAPLGADPRRGQLLAAGPSRGTRPARRPRAGPCGRR